MCGIGRIDMKNNHMMVFSFRYAADIDYAKIFYPQISSTLLLCLNCGYQKLPLLLRHIGIC